LRLQTASRQPELHQRDAFVLRGEAGDVDGFEQLRRFAIDAERHVSCGEVLAEERIQRAPHDVAVLDRRALAIADQRRTLQRIETRCLTDDQFSRGKQVFVAGATLRQRHGFGRKLCGKWNGRDAELLLSNRDQERRVERPLRHLVRPVDAEGFAEAGVAAGAQQGVGLCDLGHQLRRRAFGRAAGNGQQQEDRDQVSWRHAVTLG
jgi:hypothetical protein